MASRGPAAALIKDIKFATTWMHPILRRSRRIEVCRVFIDPDSPILRSIRGSRSPAPPANGNLLAKGLIPRQIGSIRVVEFVSISVKTILDSEPCPRQNQGLAQD